MGVLSIQDITPPKDPYIQVRVLDNIGEVLLGDQSTSLVRNSIHFMKRSEAETLISQVLPRNLHPHDQVIGLKYLIFDYIHATL